MPGPSFNLTMFDVGLACCAVEFASAVVAPDALLKVGVHVDGTEPQDASLLVVSGTVTDKVAPAVKRVYDELPGPKYVISFGACSNSGGPYWDSYSVTKGVDQLIPVDVYLPGCPPRPEALVQGILKLREKLATDA